ncbi:MAG: ISNCY family transposase, partial [Candidatus Thermoplasmatota archaeon]
RHWKETMRDFVYNTHQYLGQYYLRNNSEAEFSADKRRLGWNISQRREDRINTAMCSINTWHNLFYLYTP